MKTTCLHCGIDVETDSAMPICKYCSETFVKDMEKTMRVSPKIPINTKNMELGDEKIPYTNSRRQTRATMFNMAKPFPKGFKGMTFMEMVDSRIFVPDNGPVNRAMFVNKDKIGDKK